jgi:hypothetical protein
MVLLVHHISGGDATVLANHGGSNVLELKGNVSLLDAEEFVSRLGDQNPRDALQLDLSRIESIETGSAALIANALGRYAGTSQVETSSTQPIGEWDPRLRSGLLPAMAAYLSPVEPHEDEISLRGFLLVSHLERTSSTSAGEYPAFHSRFRAWRDRFVKTTRLDLDSERLRYLSRYCYHAVQNVFDHAYGTPFQPRERTYSYIAIQAVTLREGGIPEDYARRLTGFAQDRCLEVVINDDGNGIAARQSQNPNIYWEDIRDERAAVAEALSAGGTAKRKVGDALIRGALPGYGTRDVRIQVQALRAYLRIRTGRLLVDLDGTTDSDYAVRNEERGYMPGTVLHAIVPLPN